MNILLIRPRNVYNYNNYPPLGLISLGSYLETAGHKVKIVNCALEERPLTRIQNEITFSSSLVGMTFLTSEVPDAYRLLEFIRSFSKVPIVVGGVHPTLFPRQVLESGLVDHVVIGEGERYITWIARNTKLAPAVCTKRFLDMETLPLPNYELDDHIETFITNTLTDPLSARVRQPMRWLPYESSRGCPGRCAFCINTVTGNTRYRKKSAEKVAGEVKEIVNRHRLTHLKFIDDDFFVDIGRVREICAAFVRDGLDITWDAECRADYFDGRRLDDETLLLAKRSGLVQLTLGLESGSLHSLALIQKGFTPEQGEEAVRKCDQFDILARSSFILEIPGETKQDIEQTISFVNRLRRYPNFVCGAGTFRPYPRCTLTEGLLASGQLREPQTFREWTDEDVIKLYTAAEHARPWQVNPRRSERATYFLTLESAARLGDHQLDSTKKRMVNKAARLLAKARNRLGFYGIPLDKMLYEMFLARVYRRKAETCARG